MIIRVAVIGCGLIGERRARAAATHPESELTIVVDTNEQRARSVAAEHGCAWTTSWTEAIAADTVDAVVVATTHDHLATIAASAARAGKHVLCEKPLGRNSTEARRILDAVELGRGLLKVGFTLRHHGAVRDAYVACRNGDLGPVHLVRAMYGHGGRTGYEREWRVDPVQSGGGTLLDQGIHLLDLARWFLGESFVDVVAWKSRWFWDIAPLEDNAFVLMRTGSGKVASLHSSITEWKNAFRFEILGRDGFARIEGLGGSYGQESLTLGRRRQEFGVPDQSLQTYEDEPSAAWAAEWSSFIASVQEGRIDSDAGASRGLEIMTLLDRLYAAST